MREYETIFITRPDGTDEDRQKILAKLGELITRGKGEIRQQDEWGVKRLAYPIRKYDKGHYTYLRYSQDDPQLNDMERSLRLDENVLKFISVVYEPLVKKPPRRRRPPRPTTPDEGEARLDDDE